MKNVKKVVVILLVCGLFTSAFLPFVSNASNIPTKCTIYGVTATDPATYHDLNVVPISNDLFTCFPSNNLQQCMYLRLYFVFDVTTITSFRIKVMHSGNTPADSATSLSGVAITLYTYNGSTFSNTYTAAGY